MIQKPRPFSTTFFSTQELSLSVVQGLAITLGTLFIYQFAFQNYSSELITRTMVFTSLITANVFLTLANRSFYYSIVTTIRYKNDLVLGIIGVTIVLTATFIYYPPLSGFFNFTSLTLSQLAVASLTGFISVIWFEVYKMYKRRETIR